LELHYQHSREICCLNPQDKTFFYH
jgi:hypothetical protein